MTFQSMNLYIPRVTGRYSCDKDRKMHVMDRFGFYGEVERVNIHYKKGRYPSAYIYFKRWFDHKLAKIFQNDIMRFGYATDIWKVVEMRKSRKPIQIAPCLPQEWWEEYDVQACEDAAMMDELEQLMDIEKQREHDERQLKITLANLRIKYRNDISINDQITKIEDLIRL